MDTTMFQLRSFVHQRLYTAAEEILGEVEKTITLVFNEVDVSNVRSEEESWKSATPDTPAKEISCRAFTDQQHSGTWR
ncbi:uncharacterized protein LOC115012435 isoform X2 [Cottoperca gobio]|uniref:Uncharacterized protein LOC115012435 isoform X2 n=1 Tax=Cottoperca gobio TaxID=56716 RepID=A0A6J2Q8A0_COTGO|nr:uncharacterized protein LOC115012435 isoform X2 [Cottoperca gobio]